MSIEIYDIALIDKFESVFDNIVKSPPDKAFKRYAEKHGLSSNDNNIKLPLLSLYRENYNLDKSRENLKNIRRGRKSSYNEDDSIVTMEETLPITIDYQLDIWGRKRNNVDYLTAELLFWMLDRNYIDVVHEDLDIERRFHFQVEDLTDNSDIMSFEERGRLYRMTITFNFDEAWLFRPDRLKTILDVDIEIIIDEDL